LLTLHPLLNDLNNDFLTNVTNDPNQVYGSFTLQELMNYISWIGLEGTQEYSTAINNIPTELNRMTYSELAANSKYTHNCTN
jgi:hypothetical protein